MLIHAQQQGREEAAGEPVGPVKATAIGNLHPLHRQGLGLQPLAGARPGLTQIPGAGRLAHQHLGGEVVAVAVGQAEQVVHRR
jgi:hypothetical protein